MMRITLILFIFCSNIFYAGEQIPQEKYSFCVSIARFIMSPIRYFIASHYSIGVPTQEHLQKIEQIKQLKQNIYNITHSNVPLSEKQGFEIVRETTEMAVKQQKIFAKIGMQNILYAQQHDQLTLLEQIFTDRQKELHKHLWIVTQKLENWRYNQE